MREPAIFTVSDRWLEISAQVAAGLPDGRYVPARAEGYSSMFQRWKAAWLVFTGKADAAIWIGQ